MRVKLAVLLTVGLGLVLVGAVGGTAAGQLDASGPAGDVTIDEDLQTANGTVEVLVSLSGSEQVEDVPALQAHASESQEPLVTFAGDTDGVTVERQFWLTNAVLVTVDTGAVSLDTLAAVEGVDALVENARVTLQRGQVGSVDGGTAASAVAGQTATAVAGQTTGAVPGQTATAVAGPVGASVGAGTLATSDSTGVSTDSYDTTYGLAQINATEVWEAYGTQGEGTSVAVLDTGADPDHPDIDVAKWAQFDGDGNEMDTTPNDGNGHGTHVSGTVTGGNASETHIGVAPGADLYAVKTLEDDGSGLLAQIIAGMEWAVEENADVMSMSLGADGYFPDFIDPVRNAQSAGTTVVASAGNSGEGNSSSPGNVYDAISVGASDEFATIAGFSSGEEIDTVSAWGTSAPTDWPATYIVPSIAAPGDDVSSAWPGGGYAALDGTSMAAPHVSGALALVESVVAEDVTPSEFEAALEETAWKPDDWSEPAGERDTRYGSGIIDVPAAIEALPTGPDLKLASIDYPAEIAPNENLTVEYSIENVGDEEGTESAVALLVDGTGQSEDDAATNVTVAAGATANGTLTLDGVSDHFEGGDTIEFTVALSDFGDSANGTTDVDGDPAEFLVSILGAGDAVEGEDLTVEYTLENVGDLTDTQTVTLDVPDLGSNATAVTLGGNESVQGALAVGTGAGDAGEYTATVASENDTASANATVLAPAEFAVESLDASDVVGGDDLTVTASIENVGDIADTQTVTLDVPGLGNDTTNVTLGGGASVEETLVVATGAGDAGEYTATVTSDDDSASANVTVYEEGVLTVSILEAGDVVEGETLTVTAEIENIGNESQNQTVTLDVPGLGNDTTSVTLAGGASVEETLGIAADAGDAGEYTATVATADDEESTDVTVLAPAAFAVTLVETDDPIEGENLTVTVDVENTGDVEATQTVGVDATGLGSDTASVTLARGESVEVTLVVSTEVGDAGTYSGTVTSEDQSAQWTVTVLLPSMSGIDGVPGDLDGDRLYEDVDGNGNFTIFDIQAFFNNFKRQSVTGHAWAYDFDGNGEVSIFDVQTLFDLL